MSAKLIFALCAQALLVQCAFSQYLGCGCGASPALSAPLLAAPSCGLSAGLGAPLAGSGLIAPGFGGYGLSAIDYIPTSGGALPISSSSPIAPVGLSVSSENAFEGALSVAGELPFVSAVALEGVLPSGGAGAVNHACGNGVNIAAADGIAYGGAGYGLAGYGAAGYGLGGLGAAGYGLGGLGAAGLGLGAAGLGLAGYGAIAPGVGRLGYAGLGCGCGL